ncbi:hypothetical protein AAFN86_21165 [Roseomonas sp. CAU 1739]|uniref:hypothetical protein n=1 Tax=Roseomonas sp. CAU 1739 TaxID=3140364 RepID=UPI00325B08D9
MIPVPPDAALDEQKREEIRRQAEGSGFADGTDIALGVAEAASDGALGLAAQAAGVVVDATGAVLGATVEVAKVSLDVIGGILGGLADL